METSSLVTPQRDILSIHMSLAYLMPSSSDKEQLEVGAVETLSTLVLVRKGRSAEAHSRFI